MMLFEPAADFAKAFCLEELQVDNFCILAFGSRSSE